jgi:hypothetical protein
MFSTASWLFLESTAKIALKQQFDSSITYILQGRPGHSPLLFSFGRRRSLVPIPFSTLRLLGSRCWDALHAAFAQIPGFIGFRLP